ncbi:hypothetical protein SBRCBS47491_006967 [Sporothrix bragantina]|uniref:Uncharacterized protein n=1 Tax=Sporothrix bragantina TaxID=671064 RepID=A0ABP0C9X8_9PEZI
MADSKQSKAKPDFNHEEEEPPSYEPPPETDLPSYEAALESATDASSSAYPQENNGNGESSSAPYRVQTSMLDVGPIDNEKAHSTSPSSSSGKPYRVSSSLLDPSPSYDTKRPSMPDPAEILPPTVLVFNGKDIFSESAPDVLLYGTDFNSTARSRIRLLQRYDRRVLDNGTARTTARELYQLGYASSWDKRSFRDTLFRNNADLPLWYMHSQSKSTAPLGDWGLKDWRADYWEALPVQIFPETIKYLSKWAIFSVQESQGVSTWSNTQKQEVAKIYEWSRLVVTAPLRRDQRDLLVCLWCLYIWQQSGKLRKQAEKKVKGQIQEEIKKEKDEAGKQR